MGIFKRKNSQKQNQSEMDSTNSNQYSSNIDPTKPESSGFYIARSSDYWLDKHKHVISLINSNCRLADYHFKMYYIQAIRNFCNLAQAFPASEYHHHSYPGGLIEHSLDVAKSAVIYARKFLYTESNKETEIEETLDVFMYCCFCAALMHDAGKIVTDLDVVYINKEAEVCAWLPFGNTILSDGTKYKWRYSPVRNKSAHESAAPSLIQSIIPFEGLYWMRSRTPTLWQFWLHTIAGRSKLGGDIGKVIEFCDSNSVQKSMNPSSSKDGQGSNTRHTLAERFLTAFRQIIESGSLPLNRKGAGGWVSGDYVYLVSQRAVDSAIPVVKNAGGTGIPQNDVTIFSMLCDAGVAERHSVTNDVIHSMKVTLEDGWTGDLTFLKISKDILDPNGVLGLVDGKITLSDLTQDKGYNAKRDKKAAADSNNASTPNDVVKNDDFNSVSSDLMNQAFLDDEKKEPLNIDPSMGSSLSGSLDSMFGSLQKNKPIKPKIKADGPKVDVAMESKPDENTTTGGLFDDMTFNDLKADAPKVDVAVESKPDETTIADGLFDDIAFNDLKTDASKVDVAVESKPDETTIAGGLFDDIAFNDLKTDTSKVDVAMESKPDEITIAGGLFDNIAIESTDTSTVPINDIKISTNIADHKVEHAPDLSKSNFDLGAVLQVAKTSNYNDVNKSQDLDAMFLAIANKNNHEAKERTDFIKQAKMLITWLDDGIATGAIRYNKISNTKNYCYNCRAGWFICIWSAINAYNESNPNSTINIQRTEKIITELMNLRLIHLSNVNKSTREAVISIQDKQNINLKGVFVKRESLPKISNNNSFVDASKFTVIP